MTERETKVLRGIQGFIEWCIKNDAEYPYILLNLMHDVDGLCAQYGGGAKGFSPRTLGYAKEV